MLAFTKRRKFLLDKSSLYPALSFMPDAECSCSNLNLHKMNQNVQHIFTE